MTKRTSLADAAHVMEGRNRFAPKAPHDTLFQSGEALAAEIALYKELDFFPTPPWAVRALYEIALKGSGLIPGSHILEPACGRGHVIQPLREYGFEVSGLDIHDHGIGEAVGDFLTHDFGDLEFDAVITNPPFEHAEAFARKALTLADNVFFLCRLSFLCSGGRYPLMHDHLAALYPFSERVPMVLGRYDPKASTATEYAWFHFARDVSDISGVCHIPPGSRARLMRPDDVRI